MPQEAVFECQVRRTPADNSITFPAGTFSDINSYYLDAAKVALNVGIRAQTVNATQTAMRLGIIVAALSNAAFVRYEFQYVLGGVLRYDFAI